ncbi:hypothetical protein [Chitinophaga qingshengii]|uniref:Uncharacterized protein n=1 Tax=Chitinophaga qingshengii TaxID=1569794 RepID=A0ABR7TKQ8_9BACT|nr:hypothetical protein [Chitinophaga qingshengii]MBC9930555.1 hypothetical protein [Chitinophaga qingshengii]
MKLLYKIDQQHYQETSKKDVSNYSVAALGENLIWGDVSIEGNGNTSLSFKADLIKFSYDLYDVLKKLKTNKTSVYNLYNMYELYELEVKTEAGNVLLKLDRKKKATFNYNDFCREIYTLKQNMINDIKTLFKDYHDISNIEKLFSLLSEK